MQRLAFQVLVDVRALRDQPKAVVARPGQRLAERRAFAQHEAGTHERDGDAALDPERGPAQVVTCRAHIWPGRPAGRTADRDGGQRSPEHRHRGWL